MLTLNQITEVEAIYICRNNNTIKDDLYVAFIEHLYKNNLEQFIYLKWLLQRWPLLRKHHRHLPKRIIHLDKHLPSSSFK
jgi:hypothetical protein